MNLTETIKYFNLLIKDHHKIFADAKSNNKKYSITTGGYEIICIENAMLLINNDNGDYIYVPINCFENIAIFLK